MLKQLNLRVAPNIAADERLLTRYAAGEMGADARTIKAIRIRRRSIDARQRNIYLTSASTSISMNIRRSSISNPYIIPMSAISPVSLW